MGPGRPREQVTAAATAVGAHDFATRLPAAYDTPLADIPMSGGEAQRIGLARAWHADRLLVLDDATASLDVLSARRIEDALASTGRTRLAVTYDPALAARADLVVWLHAGSLRAVGRHEVLWTDPDYRAVFAR
jgi:ATP-binding cassette subfamily B protein